MAKDKAACVARQAAVSRHGARLGSRSAQGRWGVGRACWGAQGERGARGRWTLGRRASAGERQLGAGACGRQRRAGRAR